MRNSNGVKYFSTLSLSVLCTKQQIKTKFFCHHHQSSEKYSNIFFVVFFRDKLLFANVDRFLLLCVQDELFAFNFFIDQFNSFFNILLKTLFRRQES